MKTQILFSLQNKLEKLNVNQQKFFAYKFSFKAFSNYEQFFLLEKFGNINKFSEILEKIKISILENKNLPESFLEEVESLSPDTNDFGGNLLATKAVDSCGILYNSVKFINENSMELLVDMISLSLNSVQMQIEIEKHYNYNEKNFDAEIFNDDLMKAEILSIENLISQVSLQL